MEKRRRTHQVTASVLRTAAAAKELLPLRVVKLAAAAAAVGQVQWLLLQSENYPRSIGNPT